MNSHISILDFFRFDIARNWVDAFSRFDIRVFESLLQERDEHFWREKGGERALSLFHLAAERVPAYKDFLEKHGVDHRKVLLLEDFSVVPNTDKKNYIQVYSLAARSWDGALSRSSLAAASSGTTGEPQFWPRSGYQEFEAAVMHELLYRQAFRIHEYSTLMIIGFPMGVYVSGVATLLPSFFVAQKGYALTLLSVGNNKAEALRSIKSLSNQYDQVVMIGHPFFIKDIIETGNREGVAWGRLRLRLMFCSEGFTEEWRDYLAAQTHGGCLREDMRSVYGSSELLLMGYETAVTIKAREYLAQDTAVSEELFGDATLPQLFQYNPFFRYIESQDEELLFTSASGLPLIRFNLHDSGRVFATRDIQCRFEHLPRPAWNLPYVSLSGRSDYTVVFYAANIYPEHIKPVLFQSEFVSFCTGNFTLIKGYLENQDEYLEIHVELNAGVERSEDLAFRLQQSIVEQLKRVNMEYLFLTQHLEKDLTPRVVLWTYKHEKYFRAGLKPRFIQQEEKMESFVAGRQ